MFLSHPPAMLDNYHSVWRSLLSVILLLRVLLKFVVIYQDTFGLYISFIFCLEMRYDKVRSLSVVVE